MSIDSADQDKQAEWDQIRERRAQLRQQISMWKAEIAEMKAKHDEWTAAHSIEDVENELMELEARQRRLLGEGAEVPVTMLPEQEMSWLLRHVPSSQTSSFIAMVGFFVATGMLVFEAGTKWTPFRLVGLAGPLVGLAGSTVAWWGRRKAGRASDG